MQKENENINTDEIENQIKIQMKKAIKIFKFFSERLNKKIFEKGRLLPDEFCRLFFSS